MSLKPLRETTKLWHAINESQSLEESLRSGNMTGFLMLEDSVEAINALNTQIQAAQDELKALLAKVPDSMQATGNAIKTAQSELAALRLKPDPKFKLGKLRDPVANAGKVMANAQTLTATLVSAGQTVLGTIQDLNIAGEGPLVDVLKGAREAQPDAKIPDEKAFLGGVTKAWQPPKGAMGAIKGFLSSMGIGEGPELFGLTAKAFAKDMMQSSIDELNEFLTSNESKDAMTTSNDEPVAQLDDQMAAAGLTPDVMQGKEEAGAGGEGGEGGDKKKWTDLRKAYLGTGVDANAGKKFLDTLEKDSKFADAVADLINLEESMYRRSLSSLLFEAIEFDVLKGAAASAAEEEGAQVKLAQGLAKVLADQGIEVNNVPAEEETSEDPEAPVDEKEAAAEQEQAQAELQAAVQDEAGENQSPAAAALGAIDAWVDGLSPTSQKSLQAKKRVDGLKQLVQSSLDGASKAIEKQVAKAIQKWRGEHEETLNKSKRFAKKNFDALEKLIPQLAGAMLKKSNESSVPLTVATIEKSVYSYLNRKYLTDSDDLLNEALIQNKSSDSYLDDSPYTESDMVRYRWLKMAGLGK